MRTDVNQVLAYIRALEKRVNRLESVRRSTLREEPEEEIVVPGGGGGVSDEDSGGISIHHHLYARDLGLAFSTHYPLVASDLLTSGIMNLVPAALVASNIS